MGMRRRQGGITLLGFIFVAGLVGFLMRDCCQGHPEVCEPAVAALSACAC